MILTRTTSQKLIKIVLTTLISGLIVFYAVFRSLNYVKGPEITILHPLNNSSIYENTVLMKGKAERVIHLTLNGKDINVDESGNWEELVVVFPGINILSLEAKDQFDRNTSEMITIIGMNEMSSL